MRTAAAMPLHLIGRIAAAALLLLALPAAAAEAAKPDPLEGKWLGSAGNEREKIVVGFEFRRAADGKLAVLITQPVSNYFGADGGGELQRDGDTIRYDALALALQWRAGKLVGTYPGPNSKISLERVDALPQEPVPPAVPSGPAPRWETRLGGQVFASPVVVDQIAYVGTTGGVFNAVDTRDGAYKWTFSAGRPIYASAAVSGDALYFVCDNGYLFKLDRASGKELWRYALGDASVERILAHPQVFDWDWQGPQPLIADGVVFVGSGDGSMHAVDAAKGTRRWRFDTRGKIRTGAAIDDTRVVFGSDDHWVYSLDRATGREIWRHDSGAAVDAAPVVHDGRVLVGNRGAGLLSLAAASGELKWRLYFWGSWVESTPVVHDGVIYIGSSDLRRVSAIRPQDGRVLWRSDVFGWTWGTPLVSGERLIVGVAGGTPYFVRHQASFTTLDRHSGQLLTRWPLADTGGHQWGIAGSPALAGDSVIVATIAGSLLAFPLR